MKTFKIFLTEADAPKNQKPASNLAKARSRQKQEVGELEKRHDRELEKARQDDFKDRESAKKKKEAERGSARADKVNKIIKDRQKKFREKETERRADQLKRDAEKTAKTNMGESEEYEVVSEYLEDGTIELVTVYKKDTPGQ